MSLSEAEIAHRLQQLDEYEFERFIADLWDQIGWDTQLTKGSNDRGIDVIATKETPYPEKILIQAKRYRPNNRVGSPAIQQYSSLKQQESNVDKVLVVTTSSFTDGALSVANDLNVKCIDGATLTKIIRERASSELVDSYTAKPDQESTLKIEEIQSSEAATKQEDQTQVKATQGAEVTATDSGKQISVELTGLQKAQTRFSGKLMGSDVRLDGIIATFKIYDRNSEWPPIIEERSEVKFFDNQGGDYIPAAIPSRHLPDGWCSHGGQIRREAIEIPVGGSVNYLAGVGMPSHLDVERITIDRYDIEITLDYKLREQLDRLPDDVQRML